MKNIFVITLVTALVLSPLVIKSVLAHGDVNPQPVDTKGLPELGDEWVTENPFRGNKAAIEVGESAYSQNCARCHGLQVISGGITPDLRKLNEESEWDSIAESDDWYIQRVRKGAVINGNVYMPPFEQIMNQEAMWAIRSYIDTLKYDE